MALKEDSAVDRTDALIRQLGEEVKSRRARGPSVGAVTAVAVPTSMLAAAAVVLLTAGARADLAGIVTTWTFQFKLIAMILIGGGALHLFKTSAQPGIRMRPAICLTPGGVFLLAGVFLDQSGLPLMGLRVSSVPTCVGTIFLASMPALAILFVALRRGVPTALTKAGAICGMLAGSIGAAVYTIACINDGATFVGIWYCIAIALVAALGAAVGPILLRW